MTGPYMAMAGLALVLALCGALWWQIDRNADLRNERDALRGTITDTEDFIDAASNPDGAGWLDRLRSGADG